MKERTVHERNKAFLPGHVARNSGDKETAHGRSGLQWGCDARRCKGVSGCLGVEGFRDLRASTVWGRDGLGFN